MTAWVFRWAYTCALTCTLTSNGIGYRKVSMKSPVINTLFSIFIHKQEGIEGTVTHTTLKCSVQ
jgi:hypothetical protein